MFVTAVPLRADTAVGTVTDMRSTSAMREKPKYRSSYGSRYTGSFRNSVPAYTPRPLGTTSSSATRTYGGGGYYQHNNYNYRTDSRNNTGNNLYGIATPVMQRRRAAYPSTASRYQENSVSDNLASANHVNRRRLGTIGDWYDENIDDYTNDNGDGFEYEEDGYRYYNSTWWDGLYELWRSYYGEGSTPDLFEQMMADKNMRRAELPLGDGVGALLIAALIYMLVLFTKINHKHIASNYKQNQL